jgi:hypothetical protein
MTDTRRSGPAAQQEHDILVEMLARRITIPTWVVATNVARQAPVPCPTSLSGCAYPDIVAHEKFTRRLAATGEVETATTLTEQQAEVWATSALLAPRFFLYVPEESEAAARALLSRRRIRPTGLFLYRHTERNTFIVRRAK